MHDPMTQAFEVKYPWWAHRPWPRKAATWGALTERQKLRRSKHWKEGWRDTFIRIWHVDPCKDGSDDSCGWFPRSRHGDKAVLEKIVRRFEFDWDRVFKSDSGKVYYTGLFMPTDDGAGMPNMSVSGIVLNLFFLAAGEYFESTGQTDWSKARRWMQDHLFDILLFAENPTDSMRDGIVQKFGMNEKREERIRATAHCIYGWILREERPWWKHPKWHVHHWNIQVVPLQLLIRFIKWKCKVCGRHIRPSDGGVVADGRSDNSPVTCGKCSNGGQAMELISGTP